MAETDIPVRITFYLKSGNTIDLWCQTFTTTKNGFGELTGFEYTGGDIKLRHLDISDIEALIEHLPEPVIP